MSIYRCPECAFEYDEAVGNQHEGLPAGTRWLSLDADYCCPSCAVRTRDDFVCDDAPQPGAGTV